MAYGLKHLLGVLPQGKLDADYLQTCLRQDRLASLCTECGDIGINSASTTKGYCVSCGEKTVESLLSLTLRGMEL